MCYNKITIGGGVTADCKGGMIMEKRYCAYCGERLEYCDCGACEKDERFPDGYAEIEYSDMESAEAIEGSRFDDLNFTWHFEH